MLQQLTVALGGTAPGAAGSSRVADVPGRSSMIGREWSI